MAVRYAALCLVMRSHSRRGTLAISCARPKVGHHLPSRSLYLHKVNMAFPAHLVPAAKSAYRSVVRSARITFQGRCSLRCACCQLTRTLGDPPAHKALLGVLRQTYQSPTLTTPPRANEEPQAEEKVDDEEIARRIAEWVEVAQILRRNVVQGRLSETGAYGTFP